MDLTKKEKEQAEEQVEEVTETEEVDLEPQMPLMINFPSLGQEILPGQEEASLILYGDIDEENSADVVTSLLKNRISEPVEDCKPINFYLSSWGGSAADMFGIYDTMRMIKENREIHTYGLGKVMSAGVILLAAGTKGKRRVGKNCRVMIHGVIAGHHGSLHSLVNEIEEAKWTQERYIDALVEETDMSKRYIKKLIDRKMNVYLDAKEIVELGIADEIV
jgi:ATP-dependent Clp protease protease subunit